MKTQQREINSLIRACRNDELGTVKKILEETVINVNVKAADEPTYRDTSLLQGDTPLIAAAGNCNLKLIKYLIGKGANVNTCTGENEGKFDGMSPLQAAVSLRRDIDSSQRRAAIELLVSNGADRPSALNAKGNPLWELCEEDQPNLTSLLIELGMSATQKSRVTGITMLHRWAAFADPAAVSIIQLILAKGADVKALNKQGISPLYVAAVGLTSEESSNQSDAPYHRPNDPVLRLLLQRGEYSLSEKIDTLELAGATLLRKMADSSFISKAFQYWNEALDLRESAQGSIPKVPLNPNNIVHWRTVEWTTRDQLRDLQNHPSVDRIKMQAILVAQRILSRISSRAFLNYLWCGLADDYSEALCIGNRNAELLDFCWVLLEGARLHDAQETFLWHAIKVITTDLLQALENLKTDRDPILNSETLRLSLELVTDTDVPKWSVQHTGSVIHIGKWREEMSIVYHLVSMISELPEMITPEIKFCLGQYVRQDERNQYETFFFNLCFMTSF